MLTMSEFILTEEQLRLMTKEQLIETFGQLVQMGKAIEEGSMLNDELHIEQTLRLAHILLMVARVWFSHLN